MNTDPSPLLEVKELRKEFALGRKDTLVAVNDVSFTLGRGETLGLVGESGSGKTTVGRCVLRLLESTSGEIWFDGMLLNRASNRDLRRLRAEMQLVFQDPLASLNPRRTVRQTLVEPLRIAGKLDESEFPTRLRETLDLVQLRESHLSRYPGEMTSGEQQRVGIARSLVTRPKLVVLDEPTSNLDPSVRSEILDVLVESQKELGTSYIFISHDLTAVERISHRIAVMYLGRMVEVGPARDLLSRQRHPYSKALVSAVLYPEPAHKLSDFKLAGEIPSAINPKDECPLTGRCPFVRERCFEKFPEFAEVEAGHRVACVRSGELDLSLDNPSDIESRAVGGNVAAADPVTEAARPNGS